MKMSERAGNGTVRTEDYSVIGKLFRCEKQVSDCRNSLPKKTLCTYLSKTLLIYTDKISSHPENIIGTIATILHMVGIAGHLIIVIFFYYSDRIC